MASKYDEFWLSIIDTILGAIDRSIEGSNRVCIDVSGLALYGKRQDWRGKVELILGGVAHTSGAHATALGRLLSRQGAVKRICSATVTLTTFLACARPRGRNGARCVFRGT